MLLDPAEAPYLGYNLFACLAVLGDDGAESRRVLGEIAARPDPGQRRIAYHAGSVARQRRFLHEALLHEADPENLEALRKFLSP